MRELAERRLASDSQLQDAQRRANVNNARLIDAQASYEQAQLDLDRTEIKAPFNAVIQSRDVELGQYVNRAQAVAALRCRRGGSSSSAGYSPAGVSERSLGQRGEIARSTRLMYC